MIKHLGLMLLVFSIFLGSVNASTYLTYPTEITFEEAVELDTVAHVRIMEQKYLGKVSPGQVIELVFSRYTGGNFNWTDAILYAPDFGVVQEFDAGTQNITVNLKVPTETVEGTYTLQVNISNYLELKATESVGFQIDVQKNIYVFSLPESTTIDAGETTTLSLNVKSLSIAPETLTLGTFEGLPAKWSQTATVFIGPLQQKTASFSVTPLQEGYYDLQFKLTRASSYIAERKNFMLRVYPTIRAKFQSFGEGFSLVPMLLQPFYSLLSWIGLI